jgi:hopanoid biosynthesis associated RND transporter like protein HpnN
MSAGIGRWPHPFLRGILSTRILSIGRIVAASTRHPLTVLFLAAGLTLAAVVFIAQNFAMTADTSQLISQRLEWRQREIAFEAAFPQFNNLTMVVVDGATPELADDAARRLAAALKERQDLFQTVRWPDGGPFFEREGLLFLPSADVEAATSGLIRAAPLLARLTADPSLRGALVVLSDILQGLKQGEVSLQDIQPTLTAFSKTFEDAVAGRPAFFSWRRFFIGEKSPDLREIRHVLLVQPVMDYAALQPGAAASDAIRNIAQSLGLDPAHGVTVRLTGAVPLADEEFASLAQDAHLVLGTMLAALFGILWLAVRSARVVLAIAVTTLIGLALTAAAGLLVTGRFNLLSMAFIPLFVGLGVDFSIQFSVRALASRLVQPTREAALAETGASIGRPLALSAAAIGAGFFAFLPTSYIGVAELGTIAGLGMIVAFALSIVLLPALLVLLRFPAARKAEVGIAMLAPIDRFVARHRFGVLALALVAAIVSTALLPLVRFDFDPLNLKSPKVESMTTLRALAADPDRTPYAINVLAPSSVEAQALAQRLSALPEVSNVVSLQSLLPSQQTRKLEAIADAAAVIEPAFAGASRRAPPSDEELQKKLADTQTALQGAVFEAREEPASLAVLRLAKALAELKAAPPEVRARAQAAVAVPLQATLEQIRTELKASPLTISTLPPDLVADWMTKDGRVRLQVLPHAGRTDNESLRRFAAAVQEVAPNATGAPIYTSASADTVVDAFLQAGAYAGVVIIVLLAVVLRRARDVVLAMLPALLSGLLTFATCGILGLPLNFTNIIALPLLFGVGVAFNIYFVMAWRRGETAMLTSSLMRAVVFSALATANAFGALWLSSHPGTASMGRLLMIALGWELLVTLLFRPALLARSPQGNLGFQGSLLARPLRSARQSIARSPTPEPARATPIN